ncbi:hypothetical protein FOA52_013364 [Chlamydomonas sp. UWO 241]|nr:hypothetical protein FOA52_013364 [Chlamydomonas sp. UWO 241]
MDPDLAVQLISDDEEVDEVAASSLAYAVLSSPDLLSQQLWQWLDRGSKVALRGVNSVMRQLVDGYVEVVASPRTGLSDTVELTTALRRWPRIHDLALLNVSNAAATLQPLATATLSRLTNLTVREALAPDDEAWPMPMFSNAICEKLRVLWMPGCVRVSNLSPLAACSETLEELWMADNEQVGSLKVLRACTRLAKLDLRGCVMVAGHAEAVQKAAARALDSLAANHADKQTAIVTGIPRLVELLGPDSSEDLQKAAADALSNLAGHAENKAAVAIPSLVLLLGPHSSEDVHHSAACALGHLAANHAQNQAAIAAAGAVLHLVALLGPDSSEEVQVAAAEALSILADNHAENQAAIITDGAVPALTQLLGAELSADVQKAAASVLCSLTVNHAEKPAAPLLQFFRRLWCCFRHLDFPVDVQDSGPEPRV